MKNKEFDPTEIRLELNANVVVHGDYDSETFGLTYYHFKIMQWLSEEEIGEDGEEMKEIGNITIIKADFSMYGAHEVLDLDSKTVGYVLFTDSRTVSLETQKSFMKNGFEAIDEEEIFILDKVEFLEKYRGSNNLLSLVIASVLKALNIHKSSYGVFLKAFPVQFSGFRDKDSGLNEKDFKKARKKLVNRYKQLGFSDKVPFKDKDDIYMFIDSENLFSNLTYVPDEEDEL